MQTRDDGTMAFIAIACVVGLGGILWVSRALGASFASVCTAAGSLFILGVVLAALWRFLDDYGLQFLAGFFAFGWPTTWPVLTSIANGGSDPDSSFRPWHDHSFIDSAWMTWGIEALFVLLLAAAVIHEYRRRRYW